MLIQDEVINVRLRLNWWRVALVFVAGALIGGSAVGAYIGYHIQHHLRVCQ